MQPSLREDYLEAIQQFSEKNAHSPRYAELAVILGKPESVVRSDMEDLVSSGDVSIVARGSDYSYRTGKTNRGKCHKKT